MRHYLLIILIFLLLPSLCLASRGISLDIKKTGGVVESLPLYKDSHALLVGVSDYTNGWPDLTSIPNEINELENALKEKGFNVVKILNPDSRVLRNSFEDFIDKYGFDSENRLLFFYSGHGYSRTEVDKGYIVPADAPSPLNDKRGFARKAIEMEQIVTWARRIESKHAMFLFDSCFSGTVFQSRALPKEPPHISAMVTRPVRQFISSGSADEEVPAKSYFVPSFIRAIEGDGDLDRDGYVTGTELGMYLNRKITGYQVGQTPQYGKIRDPRLDQGDYVMIAGPTTYTDVRGGERAQTGSLTINTDPTGATIFIEGEYKGTAPLRLSGLAKGRLLLKAESRGYTPKEEMVLILPDGKVSLNFNLDKIRTSNVGVRKKTTNNELSKICARDEATSSEKCTMCHSSEDIGATVFNEPELGDVTFSHEVHNVMFDCKECHSSLTFRATMEEMEKGYSCGACHDGVNAFGVGDSCDGCHIM